MMKKIRFLSLLLALVMMLGVLPMAAFAVDGEGGGETVETPTFTAEDYNALYVDGGDLTFAWDGFDMTAEFDGKMVSWVDGTTTITAATWAWTQSGSKEEFHEYGIANGAYIVTGVMDFTSLLPMHTDTESTLTVLDDMTFELVLSNQWENQGGNVDQHNGVIHVAPAGAGMLSSQNNRTSIDATYGPINLCIPGFYTHPNGNGGRLINLYDCGDWNNKTTGNHFIGAPKGDVYSIAISHDFTMETATTGKLLVAYYRDARPAIDNSWNGNNRNSFEALYDARYVGNYLSTEANNNGWKGVKEDATADNLVLKFGGGKFGIQNFGYHAIRMYTRALNEAELQQNHAADLFKFYAIDLTTFLTLDDEAKTRVYDALATESIGKTDKTTIETLITENAPPPVAPYDYDALYVAGATFMWDAFDIANDANAQNGIATNRIDGTTLNVMTGWSWTNIKVGDLTLKDYSIANKMVVGIGQADFTSLLPKHVDEESGLTVLDDMTFELVLSNQWNSTGGDNAENHTASIQVAPAGPGMLNAWTSKVTNPEKYGPVTVSNPGFYTPIDPDDNVNALFFDMTEWGNGDDDNRFVGAPMGQVYSIAISHDFTMDTATTGTLLVSAYRDARPALDTSWQGVPGHEIKSSILAAYDARYVGNANLEQSDGWTGYRMDANEDTLKLTFGGGKNGAMKWGYHAIRMYNRALDEAELQQNHAADLFKFYGVDMTVYNTLLDFEKAAAHKALAPIALGDTTKEAIEAIIADSVFTLNDDYLDTHEIVSFDGYQVRTYVDPAFRVMMTVNTETELEPGVTVAAIMAYFTANDYEMTLEDMQKDTPPEELIDGVLLYANGTFAPHMTVGEDGTISVPCYFESTENYTTEMYLKIAVVLTYGDDIKLLHADTESEAFGDAVSLHELYAHEAFADYETAKKVVKVCGEYVPTTSEDRTPAGE